MSTTIDQRVVEMQFDNKHFERNVATTMSTLDKFKQKLNFSGATKGLDEIDAASKKVNLGGLGQAVESVSAKFSALQVMGITALSNITNSAVNAGKRIVSALTIDPIKTGFSEYETQINAVQTILANTKSKGTNIDDVNSALDELNTYADKTIYNFTEMTKNIGTFTAAGVDLDKSVSSIKGIANLAAVSGSTSQQASTAMYQLSQALASGKVTLMDWNSVVNAGMGGEVFQTALKRTAENMGTNVDALIEKYGSFRESLTEGEWLTADVLTETLTQLSGAYTEADLLAQGYTEEQTRQILELAATAESAATDVKTFTQLWDTLKESAQSGWSQTWEIIVGDFEEAKALLSEVSKVFGDIIGESAESRNKLLQGWKDIGGRADLIDAIKNAFEGVMNIVTPVKEAFREIFPPVTVVQLTRFTKSLKELTDRFRQFTEDHAPQIKSTFKGIFSVVDIGVTVIKDIARGIIDLIKNFSGMGDGMLDVTGSFGDWLSGLRDTVKETDVFGKAVDKVVGILSTAITKIKSFGSAIKEHFQSQEYEGFKSFFEGLWSIIKKIGSVLGDMFGSIGQGISDAFSGDGSVLNVINTGLFGGILAGIQKFIWSLSDPFEGVSGIFENLTGVLDDVRGCFEAYQNSLNASTLLKIAGAIGILAAAIFAIAKIDAAALDRALAAITIMFGELLGAMGIFSKISSGITGVAKACAAMISISISIAILAGALKTLSTLDWEDVAIGLVAVGGLMAELSIFLKTAKFDGKVTSTAIGIVILSSAMLILAKAVEDFGAMSWGEIGQGLVAIGGLLAELAIFSKLTGSAKHVVSTGVSMVLLGASMKILASALDDFAGMQWDEIGRGLVAMGGALAALAIAMNVMPKNSVSVGVGLLAIGAALLVVANAMTDFGGMQWDEIGRGFVAMGGSLAILAVALHAMNGTLAGSAALIVATGALAILTPVLKSLSDMTWGEIAKGLIAIAGAFTVVGVAGLLLAPLAPTILSLAGSFALFGLATVGIGAGLALIGVGLTSIATGLATLGAAGAAGAAAIVAALTVIITGILDLIPTIVTKLGDIILAFCQVVVDCAPTIADTLLVVVTEILTSLATYTPQIVDAIMEFVIGLLDSFANRLPELIVSAVNVIGAFFEGVVDALSGLDTESLMKGIIGAGLLAALIAALSAIVGLIPGAMVAVLGMGLVIAEMALVLAAIGALAQIPGLSWLMEEGGNFLQTIGTAIGQFVGGIVGGFGEGVSSSFPQIGTNLSNFMTNLQPFLEGAKNIDASMMDGVKALAETILILTAANILDGIASFVTGSSSLTSFGEQLPALATSLNGFATNLGTFDDSKVASISAAADAVSAIAKAAKDIPNEGGWAGKIFGENSLAAFGEQLPGFASNLSAFATNLGTFDEAKVASITAAGEAIASIAKAAKKIDGQADWAKKIFGDDSLATFGEQLPGFGSNLSAFATNLGTFDEKTVATVACASDAIVAIAKASKHIDGQPDWAKKIFGDNGLSSFGEELASLGNGLSSFAENLGTFDEAKVATVSSAVKAIEALSGLADSDLKNLKKNLDGVGDKLITFASDISTFCEDMPDGETITVAKTNMGKILDMVKSIAEVDAGATKEFVNSLKNIGKDAVDAFVKAFTSNSAKTDVKNAAKNLVEQAIDGLESKHSAIKTAFSDLVKSGASSIKLAYQDFYDAGSYLAIGFANGISANAYAATSRAAAMATSAKLAAEAALGIASPSKVFYKIGAYAGQGFVNALDAYATEAYYSAYNMSDNARLGLNNAINKIKGLVTGELDVRPTIRPVLDLSDIRSGASAIGSMLSMNPSVGAIAHVRSIGSTLSSMDQNGANSDVVHAINKLRKDLGNLGTTQYNINGVTYDDGSGIAEAVQTIVRHAKIGRRA